LADAALFTGAIWDEYVGGGAFLVWYGLSHADYALQTDVEEINSKTLA